MKLDPSLTTFPTFRSSAQVTWDVFFGTGGTRSVERLIAAAALPPPLAHAVARVVRATRLWPGEKRDVARELIAHFHDGLAAGAAPEALLASFGDAANTARLIRRAKKRARPWPWRAMVRSLQGVGLVILLTIFTYAALAARYWSGSPAIARDYIAEQNARVTAIPDSDRAWPLYRRAMLARVAMPESLNKAPATWPALDPADPRWDAAVAYLDAMGPSLALVRQAASLPRMGHPWSTEMDAEVIRHQMTIRGGDPSTFDPPPPDNNVALLNVLLPHLSELRGFARDLSFSMRVNAHRGDSPAVLADARTLRDIAAQLRGEGTHISELVALAIFALAERDIARLLANQPDLFTDAQLVALAHEIAAWGGGGRLRPGSLTDAAFFDDLLQRMYTDDGRGDGRFTHDGLIVLESIAYPGLVDEMLSTDMRDTKALAAAAGPVLMNVVASRAEQKRVFDRLSTLAAQDAADNYWERPSPTRFAAARQALEGPDFTTRRFMPVTSMLPAWDKFTLAYDRETARRDALLVAIACELHRRRTGAWPPALAELTPGLLPAIPPDPQTGAPMNYRVIDGKPVLYSVGADGRDDGGVVASPEANELLTIGSGVDVVGGGDWRLWPPVE